MCYSGRCRYEDSMGDCTLPGYTFKGYPDDADYIVREREIKEYEEYERQRKEESDGQVSEDAAGCSCSPENIPE